VLLSVSHKEPRISHYNVDRSLHLPRRLRINTDEPRIVAVQR
jgi:hypothetical protein